MFRSHPFYGSIFDQKMKHVNITNGFMLFAAQEKQRLASTNPNKGIEIFLEKKWNALSEEDRDAWKTKAIELNKK